MAVSKTDLVNRLNEIATNSSDTLATDSDVLAAAAAAAYAIQNRLGNTDLVDKDAEKEDRRYKLPIDTLGPREDN